MHGQPQEAEIRPHWWRASWRGGISHYLTLVPPHPGVAMEPGRVLRQRKLEIEDMAMIIIGHYLAIVVPHHLSNADAWGDEGLEVVPRHVGDYDEILTSIPHPKLLEHAARDNHLLNWCHRRHSLPLLQHWIIIRSIIKSEKHGADDRHKNKLIIGNTYGDDWWCYRWTN